MRMGGISVRETTRVLIVEDLPTDAELSEREVRKALVSCEFRRVETREAYLAALDEFRPALIVSDYRLPHFDGMTALKLAVERCPDVPFIILTGSMNEDTAVECMKAGAWDYVIKEHVKRLGPAVESALERRLARMGRTHAETALRDSEAQLRAVLDAAPFPVALVDVEDDKIEFWSRSALTLFGHTAPTAPEWYQIAYPDPDYRREVIERWKPVLEKARSSGQTVNTGEYRVTCRDGSVRLCELYARFLPDKLVVTFNDITERKRAEVALRTALAREGALLAAIPDIVMQVDANKIYTWANRPGIEFFGPDVVGREAAFYFEGEQDTYGRVQPLFQGDEQTFYVESWQRRRDGEKRLLAWWCRVLKDEGGNATGALSTAHDITERKRAEEALQDSEARFRDTFERSTVGKSLTGRDGRLLKVNQALADMLGLSIEELQQITFAEITHPDDIAESRECVRCLFAGERTTYRMEKRYWHRNGHLVFADVSTRLLCDKQGAPLHLITNVVDITARKQAEIALAETLVDLERRVAERTAELTVANQELESFAYAVSHDLRAPLRGIDGWSQAVMEDCGHQLDQRGREHLARVRSETHRMDDLIDDLLELSRVTRTPMKRETVDLAAMALELELGLRAGQPERAVDLVVAPGVVAEGDAVLLRVLLQNMLHNAWKFTGKRPRARIEFGCATEEGRTVYHVRDNGAGFDMRFAGKLFAPFQRLHSLAEFPGTGIGLATVQRIIHRHGGKVWVTAEVDQGATFYFTLTA
jgi:PAS domain S-box-containing protein